MTTKSVNINGLAFTNPSALSRQQGTKPAGPQLLHAQNESGTVIYRWNGADMLDELADRIIEQANDYARYGEGTSTLATAVSFNVTENGLEYSESTDHVTFAVGTPTDQDIRQWAFKACTSESTIVVLYGKKGGTRRSRGLADSLASANAASLLGDFFGVSNTVIEDSTDVEESGSDVAETA